MLLVRGLLLLGAAVERIMLVEAEALLDRHVLSLLR
jgi:hypothetical protein